VVLEGVSYVRCDQSSLVFLHFTVCIVKTSENDNLGNLDVDEKILQCGYKVGVVKAWNED